MSLKHVYLIALAAAVGCASANTIPGPAGARSAPRKAAYLSAEEIADAHADVTTTYDAVARLRPNWLVGHGVAAQGSEYAVVFVDGQQYGDPQSLRNIPAYHVADIRYYDITQAGARFGIRGGTGGVIEVRMKTP
jgi:hypothetical protein